MGKKLGICPLKKNGFTLVELSIVIVIIGLIIGGVTAGYSLVKQAQLRSAVTDINKYKAATLAFHLQYNALPGDIKNAYDYWGATCDATPANCNGNGDRQLGASGTATDNEVYRFWQHLYLAKLVPETYTGIGIGTGLGASIGVNVPSTSLKNVGIGVRLIALSWYSYTSGKNYSRLDNYFHLGGTSADAPIHNPIISSPDAYNIDSKTDDGKPGTGKIVAAWGYTNQCVTIDNTDTAAYNTSLATSVCVIMWEF